MSFQWKSHQVDMVYAFREAVGRNEGVHRIHCFFMEVHA